MVAARDLDRRSRRAATALALGLAGCNFQVPSSSYLIDTKLVSVTVEVVELGPLNPDRVGVPSGAPIAEPMPHDRLALDAVVVDEAGARVPAEELDSIWFQCGAFGCDVGLFDSLYERRCDELDPAEEILTMDSRCRIGEGDGHFEFVVPELGQQMAETRYAFYYGIIAWDGRSAESCWAGRKDLDASLDGCAFIERTVKVGPSWWMLVYAETLGLTSPIPISAIPAGVFVQAANRVPIVTISVEVDGQPAGVWLGQDDPIAVRPGSRISVFVVEDQPTQFLQTYFVVRPVDNGDGTFGFLFTPDSEFLIHTMYSSNAIHVVDDDDEDFVIVWGREDFVVDEAATPGSSRIVVVYQDQRSGEGVAILEFEVE